MEIKRAKKFFITLQIAFVFFTLAMPALAHASFQYVYDASGQLIKAVDSTGAVAEYVYDENGNLREIKRSYVTELALFGFTPKKGASGTTLTIHGRGFSAIPSENRVKFKEATATIVSATRDRLVVTVPAGAATGPISVTVASNAAISETDFTVVHPPIISSIHPKNAFPDSVISNLQVQGDNFIGSTFVFLPQFVPPAMTITVVSINPTGTIASLNVAINEWAKGSFVLFVTNVDGSSSEASLHANTLNIINPTADEDKDGLTNEKEVALGTDPFEADTDSDRFLDGDEVEVGSNPLDPSSTPLDTVFQLREASGAPVSVLNLTDPSAEGAGGSAGQTEASGAPVSVLNVTDPSDGASGSAGPAEVSGAPVSVLNVADPSEGAGGSAGPTEASGAPVSVLNVADPSGETGGSSGTTGGSELQTEASGAPVSILNTADPSGPAGGDAMGPPVSVENKAIP